MRARSLLGVLPLVACATAQARPSGDVLVEGVPHVRQKPDFCGEACAEMFLRKLGSSLDQDGVFDRAGVDPALGRGCHTPELAKALTSIGFDTGEVWRKVDASKADAELERCFGELRADLAKGVPSIVCMRFDEREGAPEHMRLVLGHDAAKDEVIYHEPAAEDGASRRMKRARFLSLWPLKYEAERWTVIRLRLDPKNVEKTAPAARGRTSAAYAQHVLELRKKLAVGFTVVVEPPFVVVGDGRADSVRAASERTVRWSVSKLRALYFDEEPAEILDVWLFTDRESYEGNAKTLFGEAPTTPYGWYSPRHRALIMNIATGGGTLVHEIVHPFVHANFAACPTWLNEGLGSLYEQCDEGPDGKIRGLTNWRLDGLKRAIRAGKVPSFEELCAMDPTTFYERDRGSNYAQARYLLYWLQQEGKLVTFWKRAVANQAKDPTCYAALRETIGEEDMAAFQKRWEKFVLALQFP
jgi:hypothetical protein